jgi:hypothetical protein
MRTFMPKAGWRTALSGRCTFERLEMGFSPMMEADPALYGSRFKAREGEFKVEFLTPVTGRNPAMGQRAEIRQLGVPAIPLRFLDYLINEFLPK